MIHLRNLDEKKEVDYTENNTSLKTNEILSGKKIIENNLETDLSNKVKNQLKNTDQIKTHLAQNSPSQKDKFKIEGKSKKSSKKLLKEALSIEKAGAFAIVLECVASKTSKLFFDLFF